MDKEELLALLREKLRIEVKIEEVAGFGDGRLYDRVHVRLLLDGAEIASDFANLTEPN